MWLMHQCMPRPWHSAVDRLLFAGEALSLPALFVIQTSSVLFDLNMSAPL